MDLPGGDVALEASSAPPEPFERKAANYLFHGQTQSLCETCLNLVPAKIIIEDEKVYYLKRCRVHGVQKTLISDDVDYWRQQKLWIKPGDRPLTVQTRTEAGCPFDCGLCPDHEQHSCLAIVEINEACNLACPVFFANATDIHGSHRPLAEIERMLDVLVESEGEPDLVQLSGGEPTIHPDFFAILDAVKRRPVRHVMINTNGVRIAQDPQFVQRLASYAPRLEVYLQFDSLNDDALMDLRGAKLSRIRQQALEALEAVGLSTRTSSIRSISASGRWLPWMSVALAKQTGQARLHAWLISTIARQLCCSWSGQRPQSNGQPASVRVCVLSGRSPGLIHSFCWRQ